MHRLQAMKNSSPKGFQQTPWFEVFNVLFPCAMASLADQGRDRGLLGATITSTCQPPVDRRIRSSAKRWFRWPSAVSCIPTEQGAMTYYPDKLTMNMSWRHVTDRSIVEAEPSLEQFFKATLCSDLPHLSQNLPPCSIQAKHIWRL